jgi:hypothetical protein
MARLILAPARLEPAGGESRLASLFNDATPVAPALGLGAYAGGYPVRLREALADTFEAVARYAGEDAFAALSARYTAAHPPACYNLNDVGRSLPRFLRRDTLAADLPFLPDLAELEWKLSRAFHAEVRPPADTAGLSSLGEEEWSRVVVELQPGVDTIVSRWPVHSLWETRDQGRPQARFEVADGEAVLVYRRGLVVRLELVGKGEARALRAVGRGKRLVAVLETAVRRGISATEAAAWPARWQQLGILSGWRLATP